MKTSIIQKYHSLLKFIYIFKNIIKEVQTLENFKIDKTLV